MESTTQGILTLALISLVGLLGLLAAIFNWDWIYQTSGASLLTRLIGRPAMRMLTGIASIAFIVGPWLLLLAQ
jgi:hypothetical protein